MSNILVTGASSGIGRATAVRLAGEGHHVFAGVRQAADAEALAAMDHITPVILDVTDAGQIAAAAKTVAGAVGDAGLHGLVNNAGGGLIYPMELLPLQTFRDVLEVDTVGQLAVTQAFLPLLRVARGRVVMIGTIGTRFTPPFAGALVGAKAALTALGDALRQELAPWGVRVVVVQPGHDPQRSGRQTGPRCGEDAGVVLRAGPCPLRGGIPVDVVRRGRALNDRKFTGCGGADHISGVSCRTSARPLHHGQGFPAARYRRAAAGGGRGHHAAASVQASRAGIAGPLTTPGHLFARLFQGGHDGAGKPGPGGRLGPDVRGHGRRDRQPRLGIPELTMREKTFLFIAADLCSGGLGFPLSTHVQMGGMHGVTLPECRAAIRHLAPYVGYPTAAVALQQLQQNAAEVRVRGSAAGPGPGSGNRRCSDDSRCGRRKAARSRCRLRGFGHRPVRAALARRPRSLPRERTLTCIAADVLNQTLDDSLALHGRLAAACGVPVADIHATLLLVSEYGFGKAWQADTTPSQGTWPTSLPPE